MIDKILVFFWMGLACNIMRIKISILGKDILSLIITIFYNSVALGVALYLLITSSIKAIEIFELKALFL